MLPLRYCASELAARSHDRSICPATRSLSAGAPPRYGTNWKLVPVAFWNPMPQNRAMLAVPTDVADALSGLALSQSTSSLSELRRQAFARHHPVRNVRQQRDRRQVREHVERAADRPRRRSRTGRASPCRSCSRPAPSAPRARSKSCRPRRPCSRPRWAGRACRACARPSRAPARRPRRRPAAPPPW